MRAARLRREALDGRSHGPNESRSEGNAHEERGRQPCPGGLSESYRVGAPRPSFFGSSAESVGQFDGHLNDRRSRLPCGSDFEDLGAAPLWKGVVHMLRGGRITRNPRAREPVGNSHHCFSQ